MQINNKLREALEKIRAIAKTFMDATQMRRVTDSARIDVGNIKDLADAALAEPVKNCEVGTAKEQAARFFALCNSNKCSSCPCRFTEKTDCALIWSQMPYEEGGGRCNSIAMASPGVNLTGLPFTDPRIFHNHYFGFTAENQEWYDKRFREYRLLPDWANWWISAEPLLGPIDLGLSDRHPVTGAFGVIPHLPSWVVVGCESGPNRRPCKIEWVESIVEQCLDAGVPVFVKQLDIGGKCVTDINKFPEHLQIRQVPWAKEGETK